MLAADRFETGVGTAKVAAEFRVSERTAERWRHDWRTGGRRALVSKGPASREQLDEGQITRLEVELGLGPLAHGFSDQRWTLVRVKTVIGRLFHTSYSVPGVWKLLRRHGWSWQVPARRAIERDDAAIEVWKAEVWPRVKRSRRTWAPGSVSRTRQASGSGRPKPEPGDGVASPRW